MGLRKITEEINQCSRSLGRESNPGCAEREGLAVGDPRCSFRHRIEYNAEYSSWRTIGTAAYKGRRIVTTATQRIEMSLRYSGWIFSSSSISSRGL